MRIPISLENGIEGRSLAWAVEQPGCFAYGPDGQSAVLAMAQAIPAYIAWMQAHTGQSWFQPEDIDIRLVETFEVYYIDEALEKAPQGYEVNAWFISDWKPLTQTDVERGLRLLEWSRADLLMEYQGLAAEVLDASHGEGEYTLRRILRHIGTAEWWYLDRLGLSGGRDQLPQDTDERLRQTRDRLRRTLPELVGVNQVVGVDGEFWSPRKLLRRAVWHEIDHLIHARKLLGRPGTL